MSPEANPCSSCSASIAVGDSFCPFCGVAVDRRDSQQVESEALSVREDVAGAEVPAVTELAGEASLGGETSAIGGTRQTASKLKPLSEGTVLANRYEILRRIGGGGMGAVYLASDRNLGGAIRAVKEMVQSFIEGEKQEKAIEDFKRESLLLGALDHPSIPTIFDYFFDEAEHRFYLVMKHIPGGDLATRLRSSVEGRLEEAVVVEWAIQLTDVLAYLHHREPPIVYRDLKPANVMVDSNTGRVMLIDFGIARWVQGEQKGVTAVGTMGYAPPELFSGNVDPRSDIYSLGATLFHLLTGADPQANPLLIFDFKKNPRPRQINTTLSTGIDSIISRAVDYDPAKRFQSANEMGDALRSLSERNTQSPPQPSSISHALPSEKGIVFCGFCGRKIFGSDQFCPFCGARQRQEVAERPRVAGHGFGFPIIEVLGNDGGVLLKFDIERQENLIGRRDPRANIFPEVDLSRFDPQSKISRRHAILRVEDDAAELIDNGSANGTLLLRENEPPKRLERGQAEPLKSGDDIKLGDVVIRFRR